MSKLSRRQLLVFFGGAAATTALAPTIGDKLLGLSNSGVAAAAEAVTPLRLPHPLPIYQEQSSYLPIGRNQGTVLPPASNPALAEYTALDDVFVAPEFERYVIIRWGDRVFPNKEEYFGYNCDYTGFVPINNSNGNLNDGYLWVNHEYVSFPISQFAPGTPADDAGFQESGPLVIPGFPTVKDRALLGEFMYNQGGSVVRIRKNGNGRYAPVVDPQNRRYHGLSGLGINAGRTDGYQGVTSWGNKSYQKGDQHYLIGTGPAATQVFPLSTDGLGSKIIGTAFNCSGGTTPWGTILSAEENFQGSSGFFVGVQEDVQPNGTQTSYVPGTTGNEFGLVGEKYGWMVEVDPANPNFRARKHTALGRFRHENITMRVEKGKKLVAYMGDDRRGGHTWKFVSNDVVSNPNSKDNSKLWEKGTLYVAQFNSNGTGKWIPLELNTPTNPIAPSTLASVEIANLGSATRNGLMKLPRRQGIAGQTQNGGAFSLTTLNEATALSDYQSKKVSDFYPTLGAALCDAFLAANLVGATPTARPEDLEINPRNQREVFISYTDGAPGSDGYPDSRIFVVAKYSSAPNAVQQFGGLYKITEDSSDNTGLTFKWTRLEQGSEAGTNPGDGFANIDNLAFDDEGNIWCVTDMSTGFHNGFDVGSTATPTKIDHSTQGSGDPAPIVGVFGNNWMFYVPVSGQNAGQAVPFAYGPPRCEMTGPTFVGNTLIVSVQHPGEDCPFTPKVTLSRDIEMLNLDGTLFTQKRSVPRGSNWPSNIEGNPSGPPRPAVIGIKQKKNGNPNKFFG